MSKWLSQNIWLLKADRALGSQHSLMLSLHLDWVSAPGAQPPVSSPSNTSSLIQKLPLWRSKIQSSWKWFSKHICKLSKSSLGRPVNRPKLGNVILAQIQASELCFSSSWPLDPFQVLYVLPLGALSTSANPFGPLTQSTQLHVLFLLQNIFVISFPCSSTSFFHQIFIGSLLLARPLSKCWANTMICLHVA